MNQLQLRTHQAVVSAVGEGVDYWHPDLTPDSVSVLLHCLCRAYQNNLNGEATLRHMCNQPPLNNSMRVVIAFQVIRRLRVTLTPDLSPADVQAVNAVLLRMLLAATTRDEQTVDSTTNWYSANYQFVDPATRLPGNLLTIPIHYDRLAPLNHF